MRLFPEQASTNAAELDQLYFFLVGVTLFFSVLIFLLIVYFALRYRRGVPADRSRAPTGHIPLEAAWSLVPLVVTMICFVWGAKLYVAYFRSPPEALDIFVVGKQWMWRVQHAEGRSEIDELHVPIGQPVRLRMISEDVIHSFFIPEFRVKQDVLPGRYTSLWFTATKPGRYHLFCAEYCGTSHSRMRGTVVAQEPQAYAAWLADQTVEPPEILGQRLFERHGCGSCHKAAPTERGPSLYGLFGSQVRLEGGQQVTADLEYFRRSLYQPQAHVVAGYRPVMPTYDPREAPESGSLNEEEVLLLAAYIRSLAAPAPAADPESRRETEQDAGQPPAAIRAQ